MLGKGTAMIKQRKPLRIWAALALLCGALLSGCTSTLATEGSDPYTPDDVIAMAEDKFAADLLRIFARRAAGRCPATSRRRRIYRRSCRRGSIQYKLPDRITNRMESSLLREVDLAEENEAA